MQEWTNLHYGPIIGGKTIYVSHGGKCIQMKKSQDGVLQIIQPSHLQCQHEEADTLIAFHAKNISTGHIMVRSTDTDFLIILLRCVERTDGLSIIMDYGSGNNWRHIKVSEIASVLKGKHVEFTEALIREPYMHRQACPVA